MEGRPGKGHPRVFPKYLVGLKTVVKYRIEYEGAEKDTDRVIGLLNRLKEERRTIEKYESGARRRATGRLVKEVHAVASNRKKCRALLWRLPQSQPREYLLKGAGMAKFCT